MPQPTRPLLTALLATLLLGLLPGVASAGPPEPRATKAELSQRARISLTADPTVVRRGGIVTLEGKLRGVGGRKTVVIWQRNVGKRRWVVEARKTTSRRGTFKHREDVKSGARVYQACFRSTCSRKVLVRMGKPPKPPTPPKAPTSLSPESVNPASIEAGQAVTVSGTASANLAGQRVYLQAYDATSSAWGAVGSAQVTGSGTWSGAATLTTAGRAVPLRVVFNGAKKLLSSSADAGTVSVYGWYYLFDGGPVGEVEGGWVADSYGINGITYAKSIALDYNCCYHPGYAEVNLARACTRFSATMGLSDLAATATRKSVQISSDSVSIYSGTDIARGVSYPLDLNITTALRLRLETGTSAGEYDDDLVFGDARVLCAF